MSHHPTVTLKTKPQVVVVKGRAKGPTVVLKPKDTPRIMWQYVDHGDGSLHLEASNPFGSAGARYLVSRMPDVAPRRLVMHRAILKHRLGYRIGIHIISGVGIKWLGFIYRSAFPGHRKMPWRILGQSKSQFKTRSAAAAWLNS